MTRRLKKQRKKKYTISRKKILLGKIHKPKPQKTRKKRHKKKKKFSIKKQQHFDSIARGIPVSDDYLKDLLTKLGKSDEVPAEHNHVYKDVYDYLIYVYSIGTRGIIEKVEDFFINISKLYNDPYLNLSNEINDPEIVDETATHINKYYNVITNYLLYFTTIEDAYLYYLGYQDCGKGLFAYLLKFPLVRDGFGDDDNKKKAVYESTKYDFLFLPKIDDVLIPEKIRKNLLNETCGDKLNDLLNVSSDTCIASVPITDKPLVSLLHIYSYWTQEGVVTRAAATRAAAKPVGEDDKSPYAVLGKELSDLAIEQELSFITIFLYFIKVGIDASIFDIEWKDIVKNTILVESSFQKYLPDETGAADEAETGDDMAEYEAGEEESKSDDRSGIGSRISSWFGYGGGDLSLAGTTIAEAGQNVWGGEFISDSRHDNLLKTDDPMYLWFYDCVNNDPEFTPRYEKDMLHKAAELASDYETYQYVILTNGRYILQGDDSIYGETSSFIADADSPKELPYHMGACWVNDTPSYKDLSNYIDAASPWSSEPYFKCSSKYTQLGRDAIIFANNIFSLCITFLKNVKLGRNFSYSVAENRTESTFSNKIYEIIKVDVAGQPVNNIHEFSSLVYYSAWYAAIHILSLLEVKEFTNDPNAKHTHSLMMMSYKKAFSGTSASTFIWESMSQPKMAAIIKYTIDWAVKNDTNTVINSFASLAQGRNKNDMNIPNDFQNLIDSLLANVIIDTFNPTYPDTSLPNNKISDTDFRALTIIIFARLIKYLGDKSHLVSSIAYAAASENVRDIKSIKQFIITTSDRPLISTILTLRHAAAAGSMSDHTAKIISQGIGCFTKAFEEKGIGLKSHLTGWDDVVTKAESFGGKARVIISNIGDESTRIDALFKNRLNNMNNIIKLYHNEKGGAVHLFAFDDFNDADKSVLLNLDVSDESEWSTFITTDLMNLWKLATEFRDQQLIENKKRKFNKLRDKVLVKHYDAELRKLTDPAPTAAPARPTRTAKPKQVLLKTYIALPFQLSEIYSDKIENAIDYFTQELNHVKVVHDEIQYIQKTQKNEKEKEEKRLASLGALKSRRYERDISDIDIKITALKAQTSNNKTLLDIQNLERKKRRINRIRNAHMARVGGDEADMEDAPTSREKEADKKEATDKKEESDHAQDISLLCHTLLTHTKISGESVVAESSTMSSNDIEKEVLKNITTQISLSTGGAGNDLLYKQRLPTIYNIKNNSTKEKVKNNTGKYIAQLQKLGEVMSKIAVYHAK